MRETRTPVAILGAGIVGVSCALALQQRGWQVTLIDRQPPGRETSFGNAGVLARSSLIPFNHPGLWAALPALLRNAGARFRYEPGYLLRNLPWALRFLLHARRGSFERTTTALDALIRLSGEVHLRWLTEAGERQRLRENGWLFLYRTKAGLEQSLAARDTFDRFGIATQVLDAPALAALEPDLRPIFARALWVQDAASVDNPGRVVQAYAALFASRGGCIVQQAASGLSRSAPDGAWRIPLADGSMHEAGRVVVALGPWSKEFLQRTQALSVPMAFERGHHMHYAPLEGARLSRPVYDTAGGYVLSPMDEGLRLTTGVHLAHQDAPPKLSQLHLAEAAARQAFALGTRLDDAPWLGCRPTLPDSRPAIGPCPGWPGLWLAFGHQHIGLNTGPGTGVLLAELMSGEPCAIDPAPFDPARFIRATPTTSSTPPTHRRTHHAST